MAKESFSNKKTIEFIVKELKKIFEKRNHIKGIITCGLVLINLASMKDEEVESYFSELSKVIYKLIDEAKIIIQTEKRFVLFPLPDIKREAYEIGKKYMKNFLEWIWASPDSDNTKNNSEQYMDIITLRTPKYTAEELMSIIENELYSIEEISKILDKISKHIS
ncbi:hypothetical protein ABRY23_09485 [Melioribacteraceae bacterium 4301-Me]|uniref:hypothetical protein n=1 Tax=Pyranulibacter aquaticus TaxID=3163344 RepID=UPI0035996D58